MTKLVTVSLDQQIDDLLVECASRFGISKSRLVREVLGMKLPNLMRSKQFIAIYNAKDREQGQLR